MSTGTVKDDSQSIGVEIKAFHTGLLRVSLALDESRAYWEHIVPEMPKAQRSEQAFEGRWFGSKSLVRVKRLLGEFSHRFDRYGVALDVLSQWQPKDPFTRQNICHWHLQLTDPMYRAFTGEFLEQRRADTNATIERDIAARWVQENLETEWATATVLRMATALITCATAAGLCKQTPGNRALTYPQVTDEALVYWFYLFRNVQFEGTLLANPYLASVGLQGSFLEEQLSTLTGLKFSRMGDLYEFDWQYVDLTSWAQAELGIERQRGSS